MVNLIQIGIYLITTDEVPSERAGVNLELGDNRWLDLIRKSSIIS